MILFIAFLRRISFCFNSADDCGDAFKYFRSHSQKNILSKKYFRAFLLQLSAITFVPLIHVIDFAIFAVILSKQANILTLQMRPYFIYNTMTAQDLVVSC